MLAGEGSAIEDDLCAVAVRMRVSILGTATLFLSVEGGETDALLAAALSGVAGQSIIVTVFARVTDFSRGYEADEGEG